MNNDVKYLKDMAREIRKTIITMIYKAQSGHPGGSLSISDILAVLYYNELNIRPDQPHWKERDRVILSKGHCCPALYSVLALKGYYLFEETNTLRKMGSILQGHPDMKKVPGIDMTTGSLGQGLSVGIGMALGIRADNFPSRVFVILGDGETNEGQVWEAAACASKYKLDNLIAIVDCNGLQNDGSTSDILPSGDMREKWKSFGWEVIDINGHDIEQILEAFEKARQSSGKPVCVLARTIKGKGISFMENITDWHGKAPDESQYKASMVEIGGDFFD
jgi:transketolase